MQKSGPDASQLILQHPFFAIVEPLRTLAPLIKFDQGRAPDLAELYERF